MVQSYGAGEATAVWEFKNHSAHLLQGTQFVYAVIAVMPGAGGGCAAIELIVTAQNQFGRFRYGIPQEEKRSAGFSI